MNFQKSFDELLNNILTDYKNQFPDADISQGSLIFIKSACLASALWGLYKYQDWISKQIFPDTADTEYLEHHAWIRGLTRRYQETDSELLTRLLEYIRRPPAGGNKYDYIKWALSIDNVKSAYCIPLAQGLGTVDVVIIANPETTGSEVASAYGSLSGNVTARDEYKLIDSDATFQTSGVKKEDIVINKDSKEISRVISVDSETQLTIDKDIFTAAGQTYEIKSLTKQVKDYIDEVRPVTASSVRVLPVEIITQNISMTVTGDVNKYEIALDISSYMNTMIPGQTLYRNKIIQIAMDAGAENVTLTIPSADITVTNYQIIRPGDINVS